MRVAFIEANPFVSRLHVLGPMLQATTAAGVYSSRVVSRQRKPGTDWDEFLADLPDTCTIDYSRDRTSASRAERIGVGELARLVRVADRGHLVFTALDDYLLAMLILLPWLAVVRGARGRVTILRYRPGASTPPSARRFAILIAERLIYWALDARIGVFDERLRGRRIQRFPDPWWGAFGTHSRDHARAALGRTAEPTILLVGYQDARKGFPLAAQALSALAAKQPRCHARIIGRVDPAYGSCLDQLRANLGPRLSHVTEYISDDDLALEMDSCDIVFMPYGPTFSATSGVLSRAAASGSTVIATSHGLVGWRVRAHKLGWTFPVDSAEKGAAALLRGLAEPADPSDLFRFAEGMHRSRFIETFGSYIKSVA